MLFKRDLLNSNIQTLSSHEIETVSEPFYNSVIQKYGILNNY